VDVVQIGAHSPRMTTPSLVGIQLETGGVLLKFIETTVESHGAAHIQEARYPPHSQPAPLHRHPSQDERFTIVEGAMKFRIGDNETIVSAGEALDIPKGVYHAAFNPLDAQALVVWETRPAGRTAEFFCAMDRATRGRHRARPGLTDAAAILHEYRDVFERAKPSPLVQRIVYGCLAPFGRSVLEPVDRSARA
jgi:mannose-6-phosphate isomerase-like protein (cupin superfamily)